VLGDCRLIRLPRCCSAEITENNVFLIRQQLEHRRTLTSPYFVTLLSTNCYLWRICNFQIFFALGPRQDVAIVLLPSVTLWHQVSYNREQTAFCLPELCSNKWPSVQCSCDTHGHWPNYRYVRWWRSFAKWHVFDIQKKAKIGFPIHVWFQYTFWSIDACRHFHPLPLSRALPSDNLLLEPICVVSRNRTTVGRHPTLYVLEANQGRGVARSRRFESASDSEDHWESESEFLSDSESLIESLFASHS